MGKLLSHERDKGMVQFFDTPFVPKRRGEVPLAQLERVTLPVQTRAYLRDPDTSDWSIGRVLDDHGDKIFIRFPHGRDVLAPVEDVFVRWSCPIEDPTDYLGSRLNESPVFLEGRSQFARMLIRQRGATMGMSALLSSGIEIEAHQVEVVRRILQDPVQRYLLADEVGLGKTIEAGILIRQFVLDDPAGHRILIVVPPTLVDQWKEELTSKFFLGKELGLSVIVAPSDAGSRIKAELPRCRMLVVDEAHHLTGRWSSADRDLYTAVAKCAPAIERVLLLSATPALHNEQGFLEMLHLLDPKSYPIDGVEDFKRKVHNRQSLAEAVAGLSPENALFLDPVLDNLENLFGDDSFLKEHIATLRSTLLGVPEEDDPELIEGISRLRTHVSEVYRLDRRIMRHRRRQVQGLTPDRAGARVVRYRSADVARILSSLEEWRIEAVGDLYGAEGSPAWKNRVTCYRQVLEFILQYSVARAGQVGWLARRPDMVGDSNHMTAVANGLAEYASQEARLAALVDALDEQFESDAKFVVFCTDPKTADRIQYRLAEALSVAVDRHSPAGSENAPEAGADWRRFLTDKDRRILVCDKRAEEGLNLQSGRKIVVHYDLPLNPNRLEQRLGRADRYGAGDAVESIVLCCEDNPLEVEWAGCLVDGFQVFNRSIASLQYLVEEMMVRLPQDLLVGGRDALLDLRAALDGGLVERELKRIDQQDALDALRQPSDTLLDDLAEVDADWREIQQACDQWIHKTLQLARVDCNELPSLKEPERAFRIQYSRTGSKPSLLPLPDFVESCGVSLDLKTGSHRTKAIQSFPYTFQRRIALSSRARAINVRLLRYGDTLLEGLAKFTEVDDRGKSAALWRHRPKFKAEQLADVYFRFDFIVEADTERAEEVLARAGRKNSASQAALRRRGDMVLSPFLETVWLNGELEPVDEDDLLGVLDAPYASLPAADGARDFNVDRRRWTMLERLALPVVGYWPELCAKARSVAEGHLRARPIFTKTLKNASTRSSAADVVRLSQMQARARHADTRDTSEVDFERELSSAMNEGIDRPSVRVDTVAAVFVSNDAHAAALLDARQP